MSVCAFFILVILNIAIKCIFCTQLNAIIFLMLTYFLFVVGADHLHVAPTDLLLSLYIAGADRPSMSSRQTTMSPRQTGLLCRSG